MQGHHQVAGRIAILTANGQFMPQASKNSCPALGRDAVAMPRAGRGRAGHENVHGGILPKPVSAQAPKGSTIGLSPPASARSGEQTPRGAPPSAPPRPRGYPREPPFHV